MRELEIIKLTMVGPFEMNAKGQVEQCVYTSEQALYLVLVSLRAVLQSHLHLHL